ncbi:hypothetical protein NW762_012869 [Fusarium torreyae]|uniref:PD-(D/E)XK nuclease-like domain-containing protein n=1 Tax=Fusarium torreyae TaxID=1237075 RepID=A0A9W8RN44_9HYPO|nr:hypothetical protein NW762_012869 [Fusarium torreyae]
MSLAQRIESWLQETEAEFPPTHQARPTRLIKRDEPCSKRRRLNPPTPEASENSSHRMSSSRKGLSSRKRNHAEDYHDQGDGSQETPRASGRKMRTPRSESSYSLPSTQSQYQASERSGYSSPSKQLSALERGPNPVVPRELSTFRHKPPSLEALLDRIDLGIMGLGILPTSQRATFDKLDVETYDDFKWTRMEGVRDMFFSDTRHETGSTPSLETIHRILCQAAFCNGKGCSEADWNVEVHHRLLEAALRPPDGCGLDQLVNFRLSTTASVIAEYHMSTSASKKVDFCMYIDPEHDQEHAAISQVINALRDILPLGMFNHTNLKPLDEKPIAVSMETKKTGEGWENARLQMEVWMAAHWEFLRHLLELRQRAANQVSIMDQHARVDVPADLEPSLNNDQTWQLPAFLPGIIIQGHDWHLVLTTCEGGKMNFWQKKTFGATSSSKGIYQIIYTLQLLQQWARDEYWAWLRKLLLEWPRYNKQPVVF